MKKKLVICIELVVCGAIIVTVAYACDDYPPTAGIEQLDHPYVCKQQVVTLDGSDPDNSHDNDEYYSGAYHHIDEWLWGVDGGTITDGNSSTPTIGVKWSTAGVKTVTLDVTDDEEDMDDTSYNVTVVEVGKIYCDGGTPDDVTNGSIMVLKGSKYQFIATPNPTGVSWPTDQPTWSGVALGSGMTIDVNFPTEGNYDLYAKCGSFDTGKSVRIIVVVPRPAEVNFVDVYGYDNEHDIYGVSDPVWTSSGTNDGASYTMGTKVAIEAKHYVPGGYISYPTSVTIRASWDGSCQLEGTISEYSSSLFHQGAPAESEHTADDDLPDWIEEHSASLVWEYKVDGARGTNTWIDMAETSGPHTIYAVFGAPVYELGESPMDEDDYTEDNIFEAVSEASYAGPDEDDVASHLNDTVYNEVIDFCICEDGFQKNFDAAMGSPPTYGNGGMCCCRAEGLDCVLRLLGIGPYTHIYCNEMLEVMHGTDRHHCIGICSHTDIVNREDSTRSRYQGAVRSGSGGSDAYSPSLQKVGTHDEIADSYQYAWYHQDGTTCDGEVLLTHTVCVEEGCHHYYLGRFDE